MAYTTQVSRRMPIAAAFSIVAIAAIAAAITPAHAADLATAVNLRWQDMRRGHTVLTMFDARNVKYGPVALARLGYRAPACFHGNFLPA